MKLALVVLAVLAALATQGYASVTTFPFEGCKKSLSYNRWTLSLKTYKEDANRGSYVCFGFGARPVSQCQASAKKYKVRCCDSELRPLNKVKFFIDPDCTRYDIYNITVNGRQTTAAFRENMQRNPDRSTLKITNLQIPYSKLSSTRLCFNLKGKQSGGNCPTLSAWAHPSTRAKGKLDVGLYDTKTSGYECCPVFGLKV